MNIIETRLAQLFKLIDKFDEALFSIPDNGKFESLKKDFEVLADLIPKDFKANFEQLPAHEKREAVNFTKVVYGVYKMHPFLNTPLKKTSLDFDFTALSVTLKKYANYGQTKKRDRVDEKEKIFFRLLPEIDINQKVVLIQDKLSELGLDIQESTLRKYLKKYASR
jgi:hypothetical protein